MKLRSNFTPGSTPWAMRRAQWTALGLTEADLEKPKIAIVNSSSQLASCFSHLDQIVGPLKEAITAAGGVAFEVRTAAPSDAITSAGAAPWRTVERLMDEAERAGTHTFPRKKPIVRPQRNPLEWRANLTQLRTSGGGAIDVPDLQRRLENEGAFLGRGEPEAVL